MFCSVPPSQVDPFLNLILIIIPLSYLSPQSALLSEWQSQNKSKAKQNINSWDTFAACFELVKIPSTLGGRMGLTKQSQYE